MSEETTKKTITHEEAREAFGAPVGIQSGPLTLYVGVLPGRRGASIYTQANGSFDVLLDIRGIDKAKKLAKVFMRMGDETFHALDSATRGSAE